MARDFQVPGTYLVCVRGGAHWSGGTSGVSFELGLAVDSVKISPKFYNKDLHTDDFGPDCPAEIINQLAEATISMSLVHYDAEILDTCMSEGMGGGLNPLPTGGVPGFNPLAGMMVGAGAPMGGLKPIFASGNKFISLYLINDPATAAVPWHFPATYLTSQPLILPLGSEKTVAELSWRAIPYKPPAVAFTLPGGGAPFSFLPSLYKEVMSSGAILWDHVADISFFLSGGIVDVFE